MASNNEKAAASAISRAIAQGGPVIAAMFDTYRQHVMPPEAGPIQVLECKRAYFAGVQSLLDVLYAAAEACLDEETEAKIMGALADEVGAYIDEGQIVEHTAAVPPAGHA